MARPRKPTATATPLAENLYTDPRHRPEHYRYRRADGTYKSFTAPTIEAANQLAIEANALRHTITPHQGKTAPGRDQFAYHAPLYIAYQQKINPALVGKQSWVNRTYAIKQFAKRFAALPIGQITRDHLQPWWDSLTPSQQKLRHAEFRRWFNWLMGQGLLPRLDYNPFTTADDRARLLLKQAATKKRQPLTLTGYWTIYNTAGELQYHALQLAMAISLYTTYRREDIVNLRWDTNITDRTLRLTIGKSEAQKGAGRAARHEWDLEKHPMLAKIINRAREISLKNHRCPYIISHWPERRVWNQDKNHLGQVVPRRLTEMFAETAAVAGITGTSFHEVRGLSSALHRLAGYSTDEIQALMAHENKATTLGYQNGHDLPYSRMEMALSEGIMGGVF